MATKQKLLFSLVLLLEALLIAFVLMQRFPPSGDDYSYLYQAKLLASGKMYAEDPLYDQANPLHDCVATSCIADDQGHRFSKYPPGWPAFLALGALLGVPWLIDPVLGAVLVFLILRYVEQQMGENLVKVGGLLLTLCLFFCYHAASLRAHIATALLVFAAFVAYDAAQQRPGCSRLLLFTAGALLGYSSMVRYIDWVPLAVWIGVGLVRRKMFAELTFFGVGFGLLASGNLLYDTLLSGDPLETPTALNRSPGMHDHLMVSSTGLLMTGVRLVNLLWVFPPALLLVVLWRRYQPSPKVKMYLALFLMNIAIYFFYPAGAGGPGPRYLLAYFPFLVLAVVDVYQWICHDCGPGPRRLWRLAIVLQIVGSVSFATKEGYVNYWRRDLERTARRAEHGKKIFFFRTGTYPARNAGDLTRNPPVMSSARNLYFISCNQLERDALLRRFPGRKVFVYDYPGGLHRVADSQSLRSSTTANRMYQTIPEKHISALLRDGYYFTPCRSFPDQMEFYYGYCLFTTAMTSQQDIERCVQRVANDDRVRKWVNSTSVSCWVSELRNESLMWEVHGKGGAAIRISVATNRFFEHVQAQNHHIVSGRVTYEGLLSSVRPPFLTPSSLTDDENEVYHYFFHKRGNYEWEQEFRLILFSSEAVSIPLALDIIDSVSFSPLKKLDPKLKQLVRKRFGNRVRES